MTLLKNHRFSWYIPPGTTSNLFYWTSRKNSLELMDSFYIYIVLVEIKNYTAFIDYFFFAVMRLCRTVGLRIP
jgi:hypothetical protein